MRRSGREARGGRVELVERKIPQRHAATLGGLALRAPQPDAACAAGDNRPLSRQRRFHVEPAVQTSRIATGLPCVSEATAASATACARLPSGRLGVISVPDRTALATAL